MMVRRDLQTFANVWDKEDSSGGTIRNDLLILSPDYSLRYQIKKYRDPNRNGGISFGGRSAPTSPKGEGPTRLTAVQSKG